MKLVHTTNILTDVKDAIADVNDRKLLGLPILEA